ncbi:MAG: Lrp/AsnC family transcriptional regulator [Anaeroplasmataceae bacterium]|nr:Lrp/AsnC family transcriptional regulator [Anaeroplasmataceae bacterium]
MNTFRLDEYDKKIVELLQKDSSISNIELSKKVGLAPSSCLLRVKNLKEQKILKQFTVIVDEKLLGFQITCFAKVYIHPLNRENYQAFIDEAKNTPEIVECYTITGDASFLLKIVAKNFEYYRDFVFDKLLKAPYVSNIDTSIVVSSEKESTTIPLE